MGPCMQLLQGKERGHYRAICQKEQADIKFYEQMREE